MSMYRVAIRTLSGGVCVLCVLAVCVFAHFNDGIINMCYVCDASAHKTRHNE